MSRLFPDGYLTLLDRPRMPWMIIDERLDGSVAPSLQRSADVKYEQRIAQLEAEVERLSSRKAIKIANAVGRALRPADRRIRSMRPGR
jgi:hypothetical protein